MSKKLNMCIGFEPMWISSILFLYAELLCQAILSTLIPSINLLGMWYVKFLLCMGHPSYPAQALIPYIRQPPCMDVLLTLFTFSISILGLYPSSQPHGCSLYLDQSSDALLWYSISWLPTPLHPLQLLHCSALPNAFIL